MGVQVNEFGYGTRVVAQFKGETLTGRVSSEFIDHNTGEHTLNVVTDEPRFSPVTGLQYLSTQVDAKRARKE